jgi:hypothetical protein
MIIVMSLVPTDPCFLGQPDNQTISPDLDLILIAAPGSLDNAFGIVDRLTLD